MREIKFRQAIKALGQVPFHWHYWGYLEGTEFPNTFTMPLGRTDWDAKPSYQYTGLKDKNGVEIYEGDILRVGEGIMFPACLVVEWLGFGFKLTAPSYVNSIENSNPENLIVIGNIYENPELMEK